MTNGRRLNRYREEQENWIEKLNSGEVLESNSDLKKIKSKTLDRF